MKLSVNLVIKLKSSAESMTEDQIDQALENMEIIFEGLPVEYVDIENYKVL